MNFTCPQCEQVFNFRPSWVARINFCSMRCRTLAYERGIGPDLTNSEETRRKKSASKLGDKNPMWRGDEAKPSAKRARARYAYALGFCEICGDHARDRHHVDGDVGNNRPSNIRILCRRCHMKVDGRLKQIGQARYS